MLFGVVSPAAHVFKALLGGDGLGGLEPRAGVRDQADPGEDLIRLDDDLVGAVDPLYPWRTIAERRIWQRRYWEDTIRDDRDFAAHLDYTHFNPVKHGLVAHPADWPHSSFRRCVASGMYPADWGRER